MEPMTFFFYAIIFWVTSVLFLVLGLLSFKMMAVKKTLLYLSLVLFLIPWLLVLVNKIDDKIKTINIAGTYIGKDISSKKITVEIKSNNRFNIQVDECQKANRSGTWQYVSEYDAFLFYLENNKINIEKNLNGEYILISDITTDCCNLKEISLLKE
jgi:hypothetical protein